MKNEFGAGLILAKYRQPCRQMRIQANANSDQYKKEDILKLKLRLSSNYFEEVKNVRKFGKDGLWANIGGYVGMILGFSFLQLIDIICDFIQRFISDRTKNNETKP